MCIVADSVDDVSKTKIASFHVGYSLDGGKTIIPSQLVVYSANVDSTANSNAFILPVFNPGNDPKKIIPLDFSNLDFFMEKVDGIFERWYPVRRVDSMNYSNSFNDSSDGMLEVHRVGNYKFSIMPSKLYFNKLDKSQLYIDLMAKVAIDMHSDDYSFIVYQFFQKGSLQITPFAYLCEPYRNNVMMVPTIHGHPHQHGRRLGTPFEYAQILSESIVTSSSNSLLADESIVTSSSNSILPDESDRLNFELIADFDHTIYCLVKDNNGINQKKDTIDIDYLLKMVNNDYLGRRIRIYSPKSFVPKKITIKGQKENRNLLVRGDGYNFLKDLTLDKKYN